VIQTGGAVLEASDLFVKQALLTGESCPVEKRPGALAARCHRFAGRCQHRIHGYYGHQRQRQSTSDQNRYWRRHRRHRRQPDPPTAFEIGTHRFGLLIMRLTVLLVLFVLLVNAFMLKPWLESFLFAVALAVGLTPELLPMVVSADRQGDRTDG